MKQIEGNIVDIIGRKIFPGVVFIENGKIVTIEENENKYENYIAPGFIDAHVHIESSILTPQEFSRAVIARGTIGVVNDPHEIANVLGREGVEYMFKNSKKTVIKIFFTIPSCVPSTPFDSAGGEITSTDVEYFITKESVVGLSEVMNVPGVLGKDPELMKKIRLATKHNLVVDGHAPLLVGEDLSEYIKAGITTDHECVNIEEALQKIGGGMKILIREGSAAKNFQQLKTLIGTHPDQVMFCTDDSHPSDILNKGHIDKIVKAAIADGFDLFDVLRTASLNPKLHYKLNTGILQKGDSADFVVFEDLKNFKVKSVFINGEERYNEKEENSYPISETSFPNNFQRSKINLSDLVKSSEKEIVCIKVIKDEVVTQKVLFPIIHPEKNLESDISRDILKLAYINRYNQNSVQVAYIHGIGLKRGAFATSISHDSHNIIAVGCNDIDLMESINVVIEQKGGLSVVDGKESLALPLPIAGIMSNRSIADVAEKWDELIELSQKMGCCLHSPFMTLSFMALIVIPELKMGEKGLFEYSKFDFIK